MREPGSLPCHLWRHGVDLLHGRDGQKALSSVPFHSIEDVFWFREFLNFRAPKLPLAVPDNTAEGLFASPISSGVEVGSRAAL